MKAAFKHTVNMQRHRETTGIDLVFFVKLSLSLHEHFEKRSTELAGSYGWLAARCTDLSCLLSFIKPKTTPYLYRAYNCISRQNTDQLSILHNGQLVYISSCHERQNLT